jgi:hypothetical protein
MMSATRLRMTTIACLVVLFALYPLSAAANSPLILSGRFSPQMLVRVESSDVVYIAGSAACSAVRCLRLLQTDNDGRSFAEVASPPTKELKGSPMDSLDQLVFANAQVGFALEGDVNGEGVPNGNALYATYNGARTWTKVPEPVDGPLSRIAVTSNTLYGVTMHCVKRANGEEGCTNYRLVHTSLSVKHWASSAIPNGNSLPMGGFIGNVSAFGSTVWLTEGAKWSLLVSSHDHGTTLTTFTPAFPELASVAGCDLTAISASAIWAQCPTGMQVSFFFTDDAGAKWTTVPTKQFMGTGGGYFDPVSATLAYLDYGGPRSLYRVSDAGHHMTEVGTLQCSKVNSSVESIVFTSERGGLAICSPEGNWSSNRLERTDEGGTTWSRVIP